jgi:hypothetical protein
MSFPWKRESRCGLAFLRNLFSLKRGVAIYQTRTTAQGEDIMTFGRKSGRILTSGRLLRCYQDFILNPPGLNKAKSRALKEAAATLGLSTKTVETYRSRVLHKLCLCNDVEICRFAYRNGLLDGTAAESVQECPRART